MASSSTTKNVEVYLDYATIPSLNYFLHFAENKDDVETIRLFGLARFVIPDSIYKRYPKGIIHYCQIDKDYYDKARERFSEILNSIEGNIKITFHLNLSSSIPMMKEMYAVYKSFLSNIVDINLHLYDDGSKDIINLYLLSRLKSTELFSLVEGDYFRMNNFLMDINIDDNHTLNCYSYLWNKFYNSQYYLINADIVEIPELTILKEKINSYKEINLFRFNALNKEQKRIIFEILNIDEYKTIRFINSIREHKLFVFLSTTIFDLDINSYETLINLHKKEIDKYFDKESELFLNEDYIFLLKPHPKGKFISTALESICSNIVFLPADLPLEVMIMLGLLPDKIGGFASTVFFNLKNTNVSEVIFISPDNPDSEGYFKEQYLLMKSMLEFNVIKEHQIKFLL